MPTLAAKFLAKIRTGEGVEDLMHEPIRARMIRFHPTPRCTTSGIANKEASGQIWTVSNVKIVLLKQLIPHARPGLPILVSSCSGEQNDRNVQLIENRSRFGLEGCEAPLITFDRFLIEFESKASLVCKNSNEVSAQSVR